MADVVPSLQLGLRSLEGVRLSAASPPVQARAGVLADRVNTEITRVQLMTIDLDDAVAQKVDHHASRMDEAFGAADFDDVLNHAVLMIGALPGDAQSGQTAPSIGALPDGAQSSQTPPRRP